MPNEELSTENRGRRGTPRCGQASSARKRKPSLTSGGGVRSPPHNAPEDETARLYRACDCLVQPYRGEGIGLPVREALASRVAHDKGVPPTGSTPLSCAPSGAGYLFSRIDNVNCPALCGA